MKEWQFFLLLAAIYGVPTMNRRWSGAMSAFSLIVSIASYYAGH